MKAQTKFYKQRGHIDMHTEDVRATAAAYSVKGSPAIAYIGLNFSSTANGEQRMQMDADEAEQLARNLMACALRMRADHAKHAAAQKPVEAPQASEQPADVETTTEAAQTSPAPANAAVEPEWRTYNLANIGQRPEKHASRAAALAYVLRCAETPDNPYYKIDEERNLIDFRGKVYL